MEAFEDLSSYSPESKKTPSSGLRYLNREQAEKLANQIAEYLERREFEKHPHIGLIGPGVRGPAADSLEVLTEEIEEKTEQWLSPYVTGFRVSLKRRADEERRIKVSYAFSIRISPELSGGRNTPEKHVSVADQFRTVDFGFVIRNENKATVFLVIYDGERRNPVYEKETELDFSDGHFRISVPEEKFMDALKWLSTVPQLGFSSACEGKRFVYSFSLVASIAEDSAGRIELAVRLFDENGAFIDQAGNVTPVDISLADHRRCRFLVDSRNRTWSIAQLTEVECLLRVLGYDILVLPTEHGTAGLHPINCTYNLEHLQDREIRFKDYIVIPERGRALRHSDRTLIAFLEWVVSAFSGKLNLNPEIARKLSKALAESLREGSDPLIPADRLYTFQEDCVIKVLEAFLDKQRTSAVPMSVQTAGGKTIAFLIPVVLAVYSLKQKNEAGTKALLFYPTKALIHDQSDTIVKLLWQLNTKLSEYGSVLTFGILHGNTPQRSKLLRKLRRTGVLEPIPVRYKCPLCSSPMIMEVTSVNESILTERLVCSGSEDQECELRTNENSIQALNQMVKVTRESVYSDPPDILVCTPDMINVRLYFNPAEQTILGRSAKRCPACGYVTANLSSRVRKCPQCKSDLEGPLEFSTPRILVFDEAHQLRGSFGSQVSYLMSRFEEVVKTVSGNRDYNPIYIFSSATLGRPKMFIRDFFGDRADVINTKEVVRADYVEEAQLVPRIHLFLVPKGYSPEASLMRVVKATFRYFPFKERHPNCLIFVNTLAEANLLISYLNHNIGSIRGERPDLPVPIIGGHSTDYGNPQRIQAEDDFTRGRINVLVATRTLEVGIDFNRIDVLIIYGAPFYLSDYVQRMGRAGRSHAAVVVSILPSKPIDFFFYSNYPLITNLQIREKALRAESARVSRENEIIRKRSAIRALLDYLCANPDAPNYYRDTSRGVELLLARLYNEETRSKWTDITDALDLIATKEQLNPELLGFIERALQSTLSESEMDSVLKTIDEILDLMNSRGITNLSGVIRGREGRRFMERIFAHDLRQSDKAVTVEHPELAQLVGDDPRNTTRERALGIAVGDYAPGQITSYRGVFFIVTDLQSDSVAGNRIRQALTRERMLPAREDLV
jgi:DEAD/DEAH box helicase domain-containing protein